VSQTQQLKIYQEFSKTDKGLVRNENQDAFAYFESINGAVFAVCDGMGGIPDGKKAASLTLEKIESFISETWYDNERLLIYDAVNFANTELRAKLGQPEKNIYPGTTVALVLIRDNKVFYAHAGDSRIYYKTGKKLFQLTEDHSLIGKLLKEKKITETDARNHIQKNIIYNAVGISETVSVDICEKPLIPADNDYILICSDGLTNELEDKDILKIIQKETDIKKAGKQLIKRALNNGGNDNVTVSLIRFYNTGKKPKRSFAFKKTDKKKKLKNIALLGIIFLLINAFFMYNYFFIKDKPSKNTDNIISNSSDLIFKKHTDNTYIYSVGRNIFSYPGVYEYNIINILRTNKKQEFYFYPGERFIIPQNVNGKK